jgi:hypothetical protein
MRKIIFGAAALALLSTVAHAVEFTAYRLDKCITRQYPFDTECQSDITPYFVDMASCEAKAAEFNNRGGEKSPSHMRCEEIVVDCAQVSLRLT